MAGTPAADRAQSEEGVAVGTIALFKQQHLGAGVVRGDGGHETGGTRTENDGVERFDLFLLRSGLSARSQTQTGGTDGGRADERALKEAAAAHFFFDHCFSPE